MCTYQWLFLTIIIHIHGGKVKTAFISVQQKLNSTHLEDIQQLKDLPQNTRLADKPKPMTGV